MHGILPDKKYKPKFLEHERQLKEKDQQIQKQSEEIQDLRNQMQMLMAKVLTLDDKEKK